MNHNQQFVNKDQLKCGTVLESFHVSKKPSENLAILTCMDTRLVEFLEQATGIRRGEAKIIKNAGNIIAGDFGETIRSLLISIFELGVQEVIVIGHHDCGMASTSSEILKEKMLERGIAIEAIRRIEDELDLWVDAYHDPAGNVLKVVKQIKENPLIPKDILVHGLIFCPNEGNLEVLYHDKKI